MTVRWKQVDRSTNRVGRPSHPCSSIELVGADSVVQRPNERGKKKCSEMLPTSSSASRCLIMMRELNYYTPLPQGVTSSHGGNYSRVQRWPCSSFKFSAVNFRRVAFEQCTRCSWAMAWPLIPRAYGPPFGLGNVESMALHDMTPFFLFFSFSF